MRICLIGEYNNILDEGMKNVAFHLSRELSKHHEVLSLHVKNLYSFNFWRTLKRFDPEIIHYVPGITILSLFVMKILSLYSRDVKTVISAMLPEFSPISTRFISLLKPNLILTQSQETENKLRSLGCRVEFLPCGVDTEKFTPVNPEIKAKLRRKYNIDDDEFVILHVGSIKPGRGVQILTKLQSEDTQVLVISAVSVGISREMVQLLRKAGCLVWTEYFENINEIYGLADCYIFPVAPVKNTLGRATADSIEMPLTVLEAMACNLPVIATKFGALPRAFKEGDGLFFVENENDIFQALEEIRNGIKIKTREKVLPYSWKNVVRRLDEIYARLLGGGT